MKIIKVLVDELPDKCQNCQFERGGGCAGYGMFPMTIILIEKGNSKPYWCPLRLEHDNKQIAESVM